MTWVRLDDAIGENPKMAQLPGEAFALYVCGLAYCNRNLTDGFIPNLVGLGQLRYCDGNPGPMIRELEAGGLWEKVVGGWQVHDYDEYQPSKQQVEQERTKKRAAGQAGGQASAKARAKPQARNEAPAEAPAQAESKPVPVPVPKPVPELLTAPTANAPNGNPQPTPDQEYLLRRLFEANSNWSEVTIPALVQLNKLYGTEAVRIALGRLRESMPDTRKPYGLLVRVCAEVARESA